MANKQNFIADKFQQRHAASQSHLGQLRASRRFDPNNRERAVNDLTGRLTTSAAQRQAVADALGINTRGLVIGGRRNDGPSISNPNATFQPAGTGTLAENLPNFGGAIYGPNPAPYAPVDKNRKRGGGLINE